MSIIFIFILAGFFEIGGGYLIWLCVREGAPLYIGIIGGIMMVLYGIIATFQAFTSFGRVYATYGGIFIVMALLWGWWIEKKTPDFYDWLGGAICLVGVLIIILTHQR
ncbi:YnfA family protein [Terrilactibacillus sp. BCM23-1]|uniref:YnfA family protein n=1 Tax=Terrilactibacillus tamarindi TaxID=2599694 RepID=A0A6N8CL70_9BACI|nr:YnfA family protein [Terrilactibacillus tamarindi]MTT30461.1 YnfA family protein [Terrilactibacillus tamarindi]